MVVEAIIYKSLPKECQVSKQINQLSEFEYQKIFDYPDSRQLQCVRKFEFRDKSQQNNIR